MQEQRQGCRNGTRLSRLVLEVVTKVLGAPFASAEVVTQGQPLHEANFQPLQDTRRRAVLQAPCQKQATKKPRTKRGQCSEVALANDTLAAANAELVGQGNVAVVIGAF